MSKTYTTVQGDMWDGIAYKVYGDESRLSTLLSANEDLQGIAVFPSGVVIDCPDLPQGASQFLPPWR